MSTMAGSTLAASACAFSAPLPVLVPPLPVPFWLLLGAWPKLLPPLLKGFCWLPLAAGEEEEGSDEWFSAIAAPAPTPAASAATAT
jgi:hypothetical protein